MQNPNSPLIDQQTVDRWQADGVVLLKGVFTPWIERLSRGVAALMANPSEYGHARTVIPKDGSAPFFQDYCNWQRIPAFSDFVSVAGGGDRRGADAVADGEVFP
jgi:hypothetical protein